MAKESSDVMLGCWGIGGALRGTVRSRLALEHGPFAGRSIPSAEVHGIRSLSAHWHLPPLSRHARDGVDMMPFLLYDRVTIDKLGFECLLGAKPSLGPWRPSRTNVAILERLAEDGVIVLEDYLERLDTPDAAALIDKLNVFDLCDENILTPAVESLRLWIEFYKDLLGESDDQLTQFHEAIEELTSPGRSRDIGLRYVYECVADINRVLVLSRVLNKSIYEWEDYRRYYGYKFARVAETGPQRTSAETLRQLFQVFVPHFEIREYGELLEIRNDKYFAGVRSLIERIGDAPIDHEFALRATQDVLRVKNKAATFARYIGYAGLGLAFLPGIVGTLAQEVATRLARRWVEKDVKWQLFFVERATKYDERAVRDEIRKHLSEQ